MIQSFCTISESTIQMMYESSGDYKGNGKGNVDLYSASTRNVS